MKIVRILFFAVLCGSCSQSGNKGDVVYYYNLDSLLNRQKELLVTHKASMEKWAYVDTDTAKNSYQPDSAQWNDELKFFNKMNINKPVLQGVYNTQDVSDTKSNLMVRQFVPEKPKSVEVQYLKLYYLKNINKLKKIEALFTEDNPIYKSSRHFTLEFEDVSGKALLQKFTVEGGQKMIMKDTVQFKVVGSIIRP